MAYLVISTSLNADSKSRVMAREAQKQLSNQDVEAEWLDLAEIPLPMCDGGDAYSDANVVDVGTRIEAAEAIIFATPIYNFACSASAKNLIELTGPKWSGKVVGLLCAAGGPRSYMAIMGLANQLMLDFRCTIVPRFAYAHSAAFVNDVISDEDVTGRIHSLATDLIRFQMGLQKSD